MKDGFCRSDHDGCNEGAECATVCRTASGVCSILLGRARDRDSGADVPGGKHRLALGEWHGSGVAPCLHFLTPVASTELGFEGAGDVSHISITVRRNCLDDRGRWSDSAGGVGEGGAVVFDRGVMLPVAGNVIPTLIELAQHGRVAVEDQVVVGVHMRFSAWGTDVFAAPALDAEHEHTFIRQLEVGESLVCEPIAGFDEQLAHRVGVGELHEMHHVPDVKFGPLTETAHDLLREP